MITKDNKKLVAALIPAFNEELVISNTLEALLKIFSGKDIYVIDDGSTDLTAKKAYQYTPNVLCVSNKGKASALNFGIHYFNLCQNYKYIFFLDADTFPAADFINRVLKIFEKDVTEQISCIVGRVESLGVTWIGKYRIWEYYISHFVHKQAQHFMESIIVVPGCATVYRSFIFEKLQIPTGTLTEDMDFTFLMHRLGYSKMVFEKDAVVYTQDPPNLKSFIKQVNRWYTGFWQVVRKHKVPWGGQKLDLEVALLALEGLYNGILVLLFLSSLPFMFTTGFTYILGLPLLFDLLLFFLPTILWVTVKYRKLSLILFLPHFYFLRFLTSLIFLKAYFSGYLSKEKEYIWDTGRYIIGK